jgi:hypothetical protein
MFNLKEMEEAETATTHCAQVLATTSGSETTITASEESDVAPTASGDHEPASVNMEESKAATPTPEVMPSAKKTVAVARAKKSTTQMKRDTNTSEQLLELPMSRLELDDFINCVVNQVLPGVVNSVKVHELASANDTLPKIERKLKYIAEKIRVCC